MMRRSVVFKAPYEIEIAEKAERGPGPSEVLVETQFSAISHGTEMLLYRGLFPEDVAVDDTIAKLRHPLRYPLKYGYAAVGRIMETGAKLDPDLVGRPVFTLHPHESCFTAGVDEICPVPGDIGPLDALFLASAETAVNFMMDARPVIGEKVVVFGQGVVGLMTTALLARFPLAALLTMDGIELRRKASRDIGAGLVLDPDRRDTCRQAIQWLDPGAAEGMADLVFELSGDPAALNPAIALTGFAGRILIGSWYGRKQAALELGGRFHRKRIRLISSQVSSLTPALAARWSTQRRLDTAWEMIRRIRPSRWITQQIPLPRAKEAYALIDRDPAATIQVVLDYRN